MNVSRSRLVLRTSYHAIPRLTRFYLTPSTVTCPLLVLYVRHVCRIPVFCAKYPFFCAHSTSFVRLVYGFCPRLFFCHIRFLCVWCQGKGETTWVRPAGLGGDEGGGSAEASNSGLPAGWKAVSHAATGELKACLLEVRCKTLSTCWCDMCWLGCVFDILRMRLVVRLMSICAMKVFRV